MMIQSFTSAIDLSVHGGKNHTGWCGNVFNPLIVKLNGTKSLCMLVGLLQSKFVLLRKYMGVYLYQHLTRQAHVDYVLSRARGKLSAINQVKPVSPRALQLLSILFYQFWTIVMQCIRSCHLILISLVALNESTIFGFQSSLTERHTFHTALQVFKIVKTISLPYLHGFFSLLWMSLVILVGMCTSYLFQESEPTMLNSHWLIGVQLFGTDCQMHFMVLRL